MKIITQRTLFLPLLFAALLSSAVACSSREANNAASEQNDLPTPAAVTTPTSSVESSSTSETSDTQAAEALYQRLLSQYGQDCRECLRPLEVNLRQSQPASGSSTPTAENRPANVLVALDSSGSMAERVAGEVKMDAAKRAIAQFVQGLPESAQVGLLVYGHKGSNRQADKSVSCRGIETLYPISPLNSSQFDATINALKPTGFTPIAAALEQAKQTFAASDRDARNVLYLVSDGLETCGGDPVAVARELNRSTAKVVVNVIGFNVDNETQRQLEAIAREGGGEYRSVRNARELDDTFNRLRQARAITDANLTAGANSTEVNLATGRFVTDLNLCVGRKLTDENLSFGRALTDLSLSQSPDAVHAEYVRRRLQERHQAIESWRQGIVTQAEGNRQVLLEDIQRDLDQVLQQSGAPLP